MKSGVGDEEAPVGTHLLVLAHCPCNHAAFNVVLVGIQMLHALEHWPQPGNLIEVFCMSKAFYDSHLELILISPPSSFDIEVSIHPPAAFSWIAAATFAIPC
jgi:hypothetical protein